MTPHRLRYFLAGVLSVAVLFLAIVLVLARGAARARREAAAAAAARDAAIALAAEKEGALKVEVGRRSAETAAHDADVRRFQAELRKAGERRFETLRVSSGEGRISLPVRCPPGSVGPVREGTSPSEGSIALPGASYDADFRIRLDSLECGRAGRAFKCSRAFVSAALGDGPWKPAVGADGQPGLETRASWALDTAADVPLDKPIPRRELELDLRAGLGARAKSYGADVALWPRGLAATILGTETRIGFSVGIERVEWDQDTAAIVRPVEGSPRIVTGSEAVTDTLITGSLRLRLGR